MNAPVINAYTGDKANEHYLGEVRYDCIYFGSYPQAEVVTRDMSRYYAAFRWDYWHSYLDRSDLVEDDALYAKLEAATGWNESNDITIDGTKYRRMRSTDASFVWDGSHEKDSTWNYGQLGFYNWGKDPDDENKAESETWHYFRYEPIKWRVMDVYEAEDEDGNTFNGATLWADRVLDAKAYYNEPDEYPSWANSDLRAWLNSTFYNTAFNESERENGIIPFSRENSYTNPDDTSYTYSDEDTADNVFLFSENELTNAKMGFTAKKSNDDYARSGDFSIYASARGVRIGWGMYLVDGRIPYWGRSARKCLVDTDGSVGTDYYPTNKQGGVRPAIDINLDKGDLWEHAGSIDLIDSEKHEDIQYQETEPAAYKPAANTSQYSNPVIEENEKMTAKQKVTYDTVYFGSYPQAQVVTADMEKNYSISEKYRNEEDLIVDDALYASLKGASWGADGTATVGGNRYKRISASEATAPRSDAGYQNYFVWDSGTPYAYFKYEPIRWRILSIEGEKALLLADKVLDCQPYNTSAKGLLYSDMAAYDMSADNCRAKIAGSLTWKNGTIRSWLNGYGASENRENADYSGKGFADMAFAAAEKGAIVPYSPEYFCYLYNMESVWNAGYMLTDTCFAEPTEDQVFLLSQADVFRHPLGKTTSIAAYLNKANYFGQSRAKEYGFTSEYYSAIKTPLDDEARRTDSTAYGWAMGNYQRNGSNWYLRDTGTDGYVSIVGHEGGSCVGYDTYCDVHKNDDGTYSGNSVGARPALYLDLSQTSAYKYAGKIGTDGYDSLKDSGKEEENTENKENSGENKENSGENKENSAEKSSETANKAAKETVKVSPNTSVEVTKAENSTEVTISDSKTTDKTVVIPSTVEINGTKCTVTKIGDEAFSNSTNLEKVTIPTTVKEIGKKAFKKCKSLKSVTIPKSVKTVGSNAFGGCTKLTKANLKSSKVTKIADGTFEGCTKLAKVTLPSTTKEVAKKAFKKCKSLKSVTIPKKVTKLGASTFEGCTGIKKITIKSTDLKTVGKKALKDVSKKAVIKVPAKKKKAYKKLFSKAKFTGKVK